MENWLKICQEYSEIAVKMFREEPPDDTFGWGLTLTQLWQERVRPKGLLLTGPDGCGKHTAAAHMLHILLQEHYDCVVIEDTAVEATCEIQPLISWMDDALAQKRKLCVIVDQLTDEAKRGKLFSYFGRRIRRNSLTPDTKETLFVIVIEREYKHMPTALRQNLLSCVMTLPAAEFREVFLQNCLSDTFGIDLRQYAGEELYQITEGLTYAQLKDLSYQIGLAIHSIPTEDIPEEILDLAKKQRSCAAEMPADERLCDFMETLPALIDHIEEAASDRAKLFLQELSSMVEKLPAVHYSGAEVRINELQTNGAPASSTAAQTERGEEEERIRNLAPTDLIGELLSTAEMEEPFA